MARADTAKVSSLQLPPRPYATLALQLSPMPETPPLSRIVTTRKLQVVSRRLGMAALNFLWGWAEEQRLQQQQGLRRPRRRLPDLPPDILDTILLLLDIKDRIRLVSTCTALRQLGAASVCLWADVALHLATLEAVEQLTAHLGASRPRVLRLRLTLGTLPCTDPATAAPGELTAAAQRAQRATLALSSALGALPSLQSLGWAVCADPGAALARWPATLTKLRRLRITFRGALTLPPEFAGLAALEELSLCQDEEEIEGRPGGGASGGLALAPGCLPPRLERLELSAHGLLAAPAAAATAPALRELRLDSRGEPLSLRGLAAGQAARSGGGGGALCVLALPGLWPTEEVLGELRALPGITLLDLSCPCPSLAGSPEGARRLRGSPAAAADRLRRLAEELGAGALHELRLGGWGLRTLPHELLALPHLRSVHLEGNPALALAPPPEGAPACRLEQLTLDASAALGSLPALCGMRCLVGLRLSNVRSSGVPWRLSAVGRVWGALGDAGAPALQRVWAGEGPSEAEEQFWEGEGGPWG